MSLNEQIIITRESDVRDIAHKHKHKEQREEKKKQTKINECIIKVKEKGEKRRENVQLEFHLMVSIIFRFCYQGDYCCQ